MGGDEQRVKHLELLQATVARLGQNSFTVRGWSVTLVSVLLALLAARAAPPWAALVALAPTLAFWGLDAHYLRQERLFRHLFGAVAEDVRAGTTAVPVFSQDTSPYEDRVPSWPATLASPTVVAIPVVLTVLAVAYSLVSPVR